MARPRTPRPRRGGKENKHSRSLAVVLEHVRCELDRSMQELDARFRGMNVEGECFGFFEPVTGKQDSELGNRISTYENASRYPQWGTMVRYGVVSKTWPGVLVLVSGFYAFLRDASDPKKDCAQELANAEKMASKTIAMCMAAQAMIATFNDKGGLGEKLVYDDGDEWEDERTRRAHADLVIAPLLKAYRNG